MPVGEKEHHLKELANPRPSITPTICREAGIFSFILLLVLTAVTANYAMFILFKATEMVIEMQKRETHYKDPEAELHRPESWQPGMNEALLGDEHSVGDDHDDEINYPVMGRFACCV
jgi:hypothetical protein